MYEINDTVYRETASRLLAAMVDAEYFNGSVAVECENFRATLRCTLIIYREVVADTAGPWSRMTDVIPVWWECETMGEHGSVLNDFSWSHFRAYLF